MFPRPSATTDFLRRSIRPKPDLYGPFWVCVTLIFSVAISGKIKIILIFCYCNRNYIHNSLNDPFGYFFHVIGNVAAYLQTGINDVSFRWHYDFHKVGN